MLWLSAIMLLAISVSAQTVKGKITDEKKEPVTGANVFWLNTSIGTTSNEKGEFEMTTIGITDQRLVISFIGYNADTISVTNQTFVEVSLVGTQALDEVTVQGQREGQHISSNDPIKTEVLTAAELTKGACCDLAGCFNTNASVQPATTNVITNATELRILGLSGVYNQVLLDGFPMIQGLTYTYGINNIPGPLVDNIFISKGANSVLQGWDGMSGQINVETTDPGKSDKYFLNVYLNSFLESQYNTYYTHRKENWSNISAFHMVQRGARFDRDGDDFLDVPLTTRYEVYNKFKYKNDKDWGWSSKLGFRFINEKRIGGQTGFKPSTDEGTMNVYGQTMSYNQPDFWSKTAYRFNDRHRVVLLVSGGFQHQDSWFGLANYDAKQTMINTTAQYEMVYGESKSSLKAGVNYRFFDLRENIAFNQNPLNLTYAGNYKKLEHIPGVFAENVLYFGKEKFTWIAGGRMDVHNDFGVMLTPRTLLKYNPFKQTTMRGSIGMGWRTANIFSENVNLLASSRDIVFTEELNPEKAFNFGVNVTQRFLLGELEGTLTTDYYRTQFQNQIFPDYDTDPTKAYISNFTGTSVSNGFQIDLSLKIYRRLEVKPSYNYLDVYRVHDGKKEALPFNAKHKLLTAVSYKPLKNNWHADVNIHWYGVQQLPNTMSNPEEYRAPGESEPYTTVNAQFTYNFKKVELYGGCENIFDFRQERPIIGWQDPFGPYFDTSSVWGPTRGREFYVGMRFKII